jgi:predicted nucleic acid-binding protein
VILLDTDVLSALMRDPPEAAVVAWLDRHDPQDVWTSAVTAFEIRYGLTRMADGRRRMALEAAFDNMLHAELGNRIAPVDRPAAEAAGRLAAKREAAGRRVDVRDTLIAGIALSRRAIIATRNVRHFNDVGTGVVDPWGA